MKKFLSLLLLLSIASFTLYAVPPAEEVTDGDVSLFVGKRPHAYVDVWNKYKINFGMEKVFVRLPNRPVQTQENGLAVYSAYDHQVLYRFVGYYPPVGSIDPYLFLNRELDIVSVPPFVIIAKSIYQVSSGDWVLDFIAHDTFANMMIKHRSIVTPFNAYTQQAIYPVGSPDRFEYFLDSLRVQCTCN